MNKTNDTLVILNLGLVTDYLDYLVRIVALLIHVVYMIFWIYFREFQVRSMMFLHHVNVVSLIYCIHYVFYIGNQTASFSNNSANSVLCYVSEIIWIMLKFLRLYSLLLLAAYRYTSVFKIQFHRQLNSHLYRMILSIVTVWMFSLVMSFSLKYIFKTSHSVYFCYEGYSAYWLNSVLFFIFLIGFSYLIPSIIVVILYKRIIDKLKELTINLSHQKPNEQVQTASYLKILAKIKRNKIKTDTKDQPETSVYTINGDTSTNTPRDQTKNMFKIRENKNPKQKRFAQQMVLINLLTCIGSVFSILTNVQVTLSTNPYFDWLNGLLQNVSPVFRIIFLTIQSVIPVISIIYSPWSYSWRDFKNKITNTDFFTSNRSDVIKKANEQLTTTY